MKYKYQLILLGDKNPHINKIKRTFYKRLFELGFDKDNVKILNRRNFYKEYRANLPSYCLYFNNTKNTFADLDIINKLINDAVLILPIVININNFSSYIPKELRGINGYGLSSNLDIEPLVGSILEGLSLLRLSRRIFISYRRVESSAVAIQLYEQLEKAGFDVFLDTHKIRPGEPFQDELWHRLADTDTVVLLNTPGFLNSEWTTQELAKANSMSIGILHIIWPRHKPEEIAELSLPYKLKLTDFVNRKYNSSKSYLRERTIKKIISEVESLRARSLAARRNNIITEFIKSANKLKIRTCLHPEKFITVQKKYEKDVLIIPTIGVPQAFTYNQSEEIINRIKSKNISETYLLFDHRNIREKWLKHLAWLDQYLPVRTIKIIEIEQWLKVH